MLNDFVLIHTFLLFKGTYFQNKQYINKGTFQNIIVDTSFIGPPFTVHSVINYTENDCRNPSLAVFTCPKITPGKSQDHCPISVFNNIMNTWSDYSLSCTSK